LIRLRELAIASNNGTTADDDKNTLDQEFQTLVQEIDRIALATDFNGLNVLGSSATISLQIGAGTTDGVDTVDLSFQSVRADDLGVSSLDIGAGGDPNSAIDSIDTALDTVNTYRSTLGALTNRLTASIAHLNILSESLRAGESRIRDLDVASESADLTRNSILQQAGVAILAQANAQPNLALTLLRG